MESHELAERLNLAPNNLTCLELHGPIHSETRDPTVITPCSSALLAFLSRVNALQTLVIRNYNIDELPILESCKLTKAFVLFISGFLAPAVKVKIAKPCGRLSSWPNTVLP